MLERKLCKITWLVVSLIVISLSIWKLSGCPGPPNCYVPIPYVNFLPLVPENATSAPFPYHTHSLPPDDLSTLINLTDFKFLAKGRCNSTNFLVIVFSAPAHEFHRKAIRETWGRTLNLVFLLGEHENSTVQSALDSEIRVHGDIVQGNFLDTYRNLTYKHVMGLKWVTYHCPGVKYILKTDDDVFANSLFLKEFLNKELSPLGARRLIMCNVIPTSLVKRTYRSKWRVTPSEYPGRWYPTYCSGWVVLYSPDVVFTLYSHAQKTSYFWIDDVHITGTIASQVNLTHTSLSLLTHINSVEELLTMTPLNVARQLNFLFVLTPPETFYGLWELAKQRDDYG